MKKLLSMILAVCMLLSVCGCSAGGGETTQATEAEPKELLVGYSIIDITPEEPVPLEGYGNVLMRVNTSVYRHIYGTCLAITGGDGETMILFALDLQNPTETLVSSLRSRVNKELGIPKDHIMITCSHTHAGPSINTVSDERILKYFGQLITKLGQVAKEAYDDRKPAEVYYADIDTENMNFVKHYKYTDKDGTVKYFGDNFGTPTYNETTQHATEAYTTMHVLKITREGEKDIVVTNWRAHPHQDSNEASEKLQLSSDFIGGFRDAMEEKIQCEFIYFQGAAGNMNGTTRLRAKEERTRDSTEYGAILADYAIEAMKNMKKLEGTEIRFQQYMLEAEVNKPDAQMVQAAAMVQANWQQKNNVAEATALGLPYGIRSPYHANSLMARIHKADVEKLELNAFVIGDSLAFVTAPDELFDSNSRYVETNAPFEMVLTLGYANGTNGYLPSAEGFAYTCYESDVCAYMPGIGERVQDQFLTMLKELKNG